MKIKAFVLSVVAVVFFLSAGTDKASLTEGYRPGELAPRIETLGTPGDMVFSNDSGRYTLLHFWAAYDAHSRMQNVQLWNKLNQGDLLISMISVSMDEPKSVFVETVKTDKLEQTKQLHEWRGERSEVYKKYGLKNGLRNFLIDDKGVIVATNVTSGDLSKIINKKSS